MQRLRSALRKQVETERDPTRRAQLLVTHTALDEVLSTILLKVDELRVIIDASNNAASAAIHNEVKDIIAYLDTRLSDIEQRLPTPADEEPYDPPMR